ncbi:imidazolonepropionase-like domain-containing protein [Streptomyces sp. NBC_00096]|uniref:imidazolonepropionase-like domain-containing protein n=1 Tax=Streptomyces sp. NBC_00096 TaxID=2975650 RepID=UPI003249F724
MLTIHTADLLVTGSSGSAPLPGGAVLVEGDRIARVGPYEELAAAYPHARARRWPGVLTPGLLVRGGDELLERTYYPDDPYEITELGTEPISGVGALADLKMTEARWGNSARRATQKLLARGVVAVAGRFAIPAVRTAVVRSGLTVLPPAPYEGPAALDPLAGLSAAEEAFHGILESGAPARFAAFAVSGPAELLERGPTTCVATVIGGRLLHRRR